MNKTLNQILKTIDEWKSLNSFQIRKKLEAQFPELSVEKYSWISESIELSKRLSEKNFIYPLWLSSIQTFEQATNLNIAKFHSRLLSNHSGHILDACAGAGFDAVAFLNDGNEVSSCEINQSTVSKLNLNRELYGLNRWKILNSNAVNENPKNYSAVYFDPMRRINNKRMVRIEDYSPGINELGKFLQSGLPVLIKVSPLLTITPELIDSFQLIYVSHDFECKEILLGKNVTHHPKNSIYISDHDSLFNLDNFPLTETKTLTNEINSFPWIYEPNPALLKSGFVKSVASQFEIVQPSENCGYFFGSNSSVEHLFRRYQLIDSQFYKINKINRMMNEFTGEIILKKKNSSLDLNSIKLRKRKVSGSTKTIFFISENEGETVFWIGKSVE